MESKWITLVHGDICGIPPVTNICNYKPTSHVELKTIPLGEPLKIHWDIQNLVHLWNDYLLQIIYWKKKKHIWHAKGVFQWIICENRGNTLKVGIFHCADNTLPFWVQFCYNFCDSTPCLGYFLQFWNFVIIKLNPLMTKFSNVFRQNKSTYNWKVHLDRRLLRSLSRIPDWPLLMLLYLQPHLWFRKQRPKIRCTMYPLVWHGRIVFQNITACLGNWYGIRRTM